MATSSPALLDPARSTPDVAEQRARTRAIVSPRSGERGLDIGCGFGLLACELARDVGPTGRVMGVDAVPDMIAACEERARHDAVSGRTEFRQAAAEALPFGPREATLAADLYRVVRRARQREFDLGVAACALAGGAALWTLNAQDFRDIPGLDLFEA